MAQRKSNRHRGSLTDSNPGRRWHDELKPETKRSILAIVFFVLAILTLLAYWGRAGFLGNVIFRGLEFAVGRAYFIAPVTFLVAAFSFLFGARRHLYAATLIGSGLFLVSALSLVELFTDGRAGGWIGFLANWPLERVFDFWAALVIEVAILLVAILVIGNIPLFRPFGGPPGEPSPDVLPQARAEAGGVAQALERAMASVKEAVRRPEESGAAPAPGVLVESAQTVRERESSATLKKRAKEFVYTFPPLTLLDDDRGTPSAGDIRANANIVRRTLLNFGIDVEMGEVSVGPTVTQYTLKPAEGVKLSRIVALQNDLALALAAHPIRIEAPIPGKSLIGIEVPNHSIALVGLRSLLDTDTFASAAAPLLFALGRDVAGTPVYANLDRMPHLLVAGATGSGKSVMLHSMITAFLYRNPPELLRFLIIDPKRVELSVYSGIPQLLAPPITDAKKTIRALRWAVTEMERRYEMLSAAGVRDVLNYNGQVEKDKEDRELIPYLVIVIDELADLMAAYPREVEGSIIRLAQMSRAVGIHLVVSTQRPSVEVITGLIKANITSRIAFQVASQVDSRTILDIAGAEKLLGNGDMLFLAGDTAKPRRIQGGFVSEEEVRRVVEFIRKQGIPAEEAEIFEREGTPAESVIDFETFGEGEDPLYEEARRLVIEAGKASASYLQRRLKIGYARAARLLDIMEERGIIGPGEGAKPREIFVKRETSES